MLAITAVAGLWLPRAATAQRYFDADGHMRVSLAQQPLSPNSSSAGPHTMAFGGIQGILERMRATVRVRLGTSLGHYADIVARNEREGWFTVGLFATCSSMPGMVAGLQRSPTGGAPLKVGMLWLDAQPDIDPPLRDEQVVMGGVRLTEALEQTLLDSSGIQQVSVEDLRTRSAALWARLDRLHRENDKLYIHIDLDVLDPREVAHHPNAVPGGPSSEELATLFDSIFTRYPKASAIGFATIPAQDEEGLALAAVNRMIEGAVRGVMRRREAEGRARIAATGLMINYAGNAWTRFTVLEVDGRLRYDRARRPELGRDPNNATWFPGDVSHPRFGSRAAEGAFVVKHASQVDASTDSLHREAFTVESTILGESRPINVYTPPQYRQHESLRLPVLYMPDGGLDEDFPHMAATVDSLIAARAMRPVILVGIPNTQRRRDLTGQTRVASDSAIAPRVGGSAAFRAFIRDELMPGVAEQYRTTDERYIIGESLAGLFVLETFFVEPSLFTGYIAFDPSLWWDKGSLVEHAAERIAADSRTGRAVFVSASEDDVDGLATRLDSIVRREAGAAAGAAAETAGLDWRFVSRSDLTHATIFRAMKVEALRSLLAP